MVKPSPLTDCFYDIFAYQSHEETGAYSYYVKDEEFGFEIPTACPGVPSEILVPKNTWEDKAAYDVQKEKLIKLFQNNFKQFAENVNADINAAGPKVGALIA